MADVDVEPALPAGYGLALQAMKEAVGAARWRAQRAVNTEMLTLYWRLGDMILSQQQAEPWGSKVVERLARDLRAAFPEMTGLSRTNLSYMRSLAAAWPLEAIVQHSVGQLPWGHVTVLLDKLADRELRDWYAGQAAGNGWSRNVLTHQIAVDLHARLGAAPSNFAAQLPPSDSELAQQLTRDPYVLDFLDAQGPLTERDLETALTEHLQAFLLELGHGFAFVGRQYRFEVDGEDFRIDLLFFNWAQSRFVVVELKVGKFQPEHAGQLSFYVAWVDANMRDPTRHSPTIGLVLCTDRSENVVRYSLAGSTSALAVASYTYDSLPTAARAAVPTDSELAAAADAAVRHLADPSTS